MRRTVHERVPVGSRRPASALGNFWRSVTNGTARCWRRRRRGMYSRRATRAWVWVYSRKSWRFFANKPGAECDAVRAGGYPSLFETDDGHLALLWGPAALGNHACNSRLVLSPSLSPSAAASDGPNTVHVVVCGQNDVTVQAGEEVLLQYKRPYFADTEVCRCRACAAKNPKSTTETVRRS